MVYLLKEVAFQQERRNLMSKGGGISRDLVRALSKNAGQVPPAPDPFQGDAAGPSKGVPSPDT